MKSKFHLQREKLRISMPLLLTYTDRMNAIPSNCIVTKLDRQQMQGYDVMRLFYFDINLYHLRTRRDTGSRDLNTARLYNSITTWK